MKLTIHENEKIIKTVRQHILVLMPRVLLWVLILIVLLTWRYAGHFLFYGQWGWVIGVALVLAAIAVGWKWFQRDHSMLVVTNQRVVAHIRQGLFSTTVLDMLYGDIGEISYEKKGLGAAIADYGTIKLRTDGATVHIFDHMGDPEAVVAIINKIRT